MRKYIITLVAYLASICTVYGQQSSQVQVNLSGDMVGTHTFTNMEYGRIDNPAAGIPKERTLGFFSVPPTPSKNLEVAFVIANLPGTGIDTGVYNMVKVENDFPVFNSIGKLGFITVVNTVDGTPKDEYYTDSGTITVEKVSQNNVSGIFSATLKTTDATKQISITGSFSIKL